MDVFYTGPSEDGRYIVSVDVGDGRTEGLEYERDSMLRMICSVAASNKAEQIQVFIDGAEEPVCVPGSVVRRLRRGKDLSPDDLLIGTYPFAVGRPQHWETASQFLPLREVYGEERYECPACGGHAYLGTTYLRCHCDAVLPLQIHPMGVFVDLVKALRQNPKQERWFIPRPWNPNKPWMSREQLKAALGLSKEQ